MPYTSLDELNVAPKASPSAIPKTPSTPVKTGGYISLDNLGKTPAVKTSVSAPAPTPGKITAKTLSEGLSQPNILKIKPVDTSKTFAKTLKVATKEAQNRGETISQSKGNAKISLWDAVKDLFNNDKENDTVKTIKDQGKVSVDIYNEKEKIKSDIVKKEVKDTFNKSSPITGGLISGSLSTFSTLESAGSVVARKLGANKIAAKLDVQANKDKELKRIFDEDYRQAFSTNDYTFKEKITSAPVRFVAGLISEAVPGLAGIVGTGFAASSVGAGVVGATVASTGVGALMNFGGAYQDAREKLPEGPSENVAFKVMISTSALEALPFFRLFGKVARKEISQIYTRNLTKELVKEFVKQGSLESGTEMSQTVIENAWKKTYDDKQDLFEGVLESGVAAFGSGGLLGSVVGASQALATNISEKIEERKITTDENLPVFDIVNNEKTAKVLVEDVKKSIQEHGTEATMLALTENLGISPSTASKVIKDATTPTVEDDFQTINAEILAKINNESEQNKYIPIDETEGVDIDKLPNVNKASEIHEDAKKYKTSEEFVKDKINSYHGGSEIKDVQMGKSKYAKTFFVSDNIDYAKEYAGEKGVINDIHIKPDANLIDIKNAPQNVINKIKKMAQGEATGKEITIQRPDGSSITMPKYKNIPESEYGNLSMKEVIEGAIRGKSYYAEAPGLVKIYKDLGYDGMVTYEDAGMRGKNIGVWNKDKILTRSQLEKVYQEANSDKRPKPSTAEIKEQTETRISKTKEYTEEVKNEYKKHPEAEQTLEYILASLEIAEAGKRIFIENTNEPGVEVQGIPSTFPAWIPENLRSRKAINKLLENFKDIDSIQYPTKLNNTAQRDFVNTVLNQLDESLGINTSKIRNKINQLYEKNDTATDQENESESSIGDPGDQEGNLTEEEISKAYDEFIDDQGGSKKPPIETNKEADESKPPSEFLSRVYERMKAEHPDILTDELSYDNITLKKEAEKAVELLEKDPQEAYRIAMGIEVSSEVLSTSVNIAMTEKAFSDGNNKLASQLIRNRSLAQTRRGQEIVAEKGSVTDNSASRYIKELISNKMDKLADSFLIKVGEKAKGKFRGSKKQKVMDYIDDEVTKIQKNIKTKKQLDLKEAQALIDKLTC